jgi:hypothetical protein
LTSCAGSGEVLAATSARTKGKGVQPGFMTAASFGIGVWY